MKGVYVIFNSKSSITVLEMILRYIVHLLFGMVYPKWTKSRHGFISDLKSRDS
jgi:hypothetical protein